VSTTALRQQPTVTSPPARLERRQLARLMAWYLVSRATVWAAILGAWTLRPELSLYALVRRLDAAWYLDTARFGYAAEPATHAAIEQGSAVLRGAFFPLWPLLVRFARVPGVPLEASATVLATALGFGVVVGSWLLVARLVDREAGDRAALLVCFFPGSVALSVAYAEALMLCLVVACLLALHERRWWTAGVLAALATATRPNAIAILPACAWAAAVAIRQRREWRSVVAPLLAPVGVLAFHGYLWWHTGRRDAWQLIQRNGWDEQIDLGVRNAQRLRDLVLWRQPDPGTVLLGVGLLVLLAGLWALWRWRPPGTLWLYTAGAIGLALLARTLGPRPRFLLTAIPLIWALAVWLREEHFRVVLSASATGLAILSAMYIVGSVAKL